MSYEIYGTYIMTDSLLLILRTIPLPVSRCAKVAELFIGSGRASNNK